MASNWPEGNAIKILRVSSDLYPEVVGGATIHVHSMSRLQVRMGSEVVVFTADHGGRPRRESVDGYDIVRFRPLVKVYGNTIMPSMLFRILADRKRYDIVHAHSYTYFSTNACAFARIFGGPPLVITMHGLISATAPGWLSVLYLKTLGSWTLRAADRIICYTEEEKEDMVNLGVRREKIFVIHNGTDTDLFRPAEKPGGLNRLVYVGRLVPGKGADYLVDAFAMALKTMPDLTLTMIGSGPMLAAIREKIAGLRIGDRVTIREQVPNEEMAAIYRSSDLFILPSLSEGVPRAILEAMACGLPVVCTDFPQLRGLMDGCGLLVPTKDGRALADAIIKVLSVPGLAHTLGSHGRERVLQGYSWEDTVRKTMALYGDVIASGRERHFKRERSDAGSSRRPV